MFAERDELDAYTNCLLDTYGLREKIRLNHCVIGVRWDDDAQLWEVEVTGKDPLRCRYLIHATGQLSNPKIPAIAGKSTGHTSALIGVEAQVNYTVKGIIHANDRQKVIEVKPQAEEAYTDMIHTRMKNTVWMPGFERKIIFFPSFSAQLWNQREYHRPR